MRSSRGATRSRWIPVLALAAVVGAFLYAQRGGGPSGDGAAPGAPRLPREFEGLVRAGGAPFPGARVRLYEDVARGFVSEGRAGEDGRFRLRWTPTLATEISALRIAAWDDEGRYARTISVAAPAGTTIDLLAPADVLGRVVDPRGSPVAGAKVAAVVRHSAEEALLAESDADGRFALPLRAPLGAPLDLLVRAPGRAARVERRFRGGDPVTVHLAAGEDVRLRILDPTGRPVADARVRLASPRSLSAAAPFAVSGPDGRVVLEGVSDGSRASVAVEAEGFLPVEAPAWPGLPSDVILWPCRDVVVVAWDAWNSKGIEGVRFEVDPHPVRGQEWWGPDPASVDRPVPVRPGATAGSYVARMPRCRVTVNLTAFGYGEGAGEVPEEAQEATIRLEPPLSRDKPSLLRLEAPSGTPPFDVIVADDGGAFLRKVSLRDGEAEVIVPPRLRLQVGSGAARDGQFLPKHTVDGLRPGERRTLRLGTRPARLLRITIDPPVDGSATLVLEDLARAVTPTRVPVAGGRAQFWVAPFRRYSLAVTPPPGFFVHEADVEIASEDQDLELRLLAAARLSYRVVDEWANPVSFAKVLVYEPGEGGKMALGSTPREAEADARGFVAFDALRAGETAVEIGADLFRSRRAIVHLSAEAPVDGGAVILAPRGVFAGTVVDGAGAPLAGVKVRVLPPRIAWLPMPGGGSRELCDLTESALGDGITDEQGRFSVPDRSPTPPLIAFYPGTGLAPMAFEPSEEYVLAPTAYVELELPTGPDGVYLLVGPRKALLVKTDPPLSLRPLPLLLPAGRSRLFVKLRDWRWGAKDLDLRAGETTRLRLDWKR